MSGIIRFHEWKQLFLFVGQKGVNRSNLATFNGGGSGYQGTDSRETPSYSCSGGGATDIRLVGGEWDDMTSLLSRIMVAAGWRGSKLQRVELRKLSCTRWFWWNCDRWFW